MNDELDLPKPVFDFYRGIPERTPFTGIRIPVFPFADKDYFSGGSFRLMHIGLNAYLGSGDAERLEVNDADRAEAACWWRGWIKEEEFKFHKAVGAYTREFEDKSPSKYCCNAVKLLLPPEDGKKATSLSKDLLEWSQAEMKREFQILYELEAMPEIVLVYGKDTWELVWPYFFHESCPGRVRDIERHRAFEVQFPEKKVFVGRVTHPSRAHLQGDKKVDARKLREKFGV